ncbi:uncharacterized protein SCHCODRAFT_02665709 [Schizophyllum commune H4-8]|uniref:uncharacterized protein n=1 Tax=Schizophyllum commune (strain H4-8 / FGSC 9210) TaxID=578458 RepID=UPI00215E60A5|nr:uncharacterized protein SCHCODRAFT_02665709 [Schizophyllum commune H4-8]KAI5895350.1 hypothetical protein SCHCODRAFT_02665709 [Schizophyllum commune H4-8]
MPGTSSQRPARARAINPFSVIYHPVNSTRATPKEAITRLTQTPSRDARRRARRRGRVYTSDKQALAITAALAPRRHAQRPSMIAGTALPPRELPRPDLLPVTLAPRIVSEGARRRLDCSIRSP